MISQNGKADQLCVLQLGMHERGSGGGADRIFWDLFDHLANSPDLSLSAFFFSHRSATVEERTGEFCLGSSGLSGGQRLWNLRRAVLAKVADQSTSRPSIVVSHFALYASALLPQLAGLKHVVHFHGPWAIESAIEGKGRFNVTFKRLIERAVYSSANAFITLSEAFRKVVVAEYKVNCELVHVIPPAVNLQRFVPGDRQQARERLGWPQNATILLCVRRLARRMGLDVLVEAFKQVAGAHPDSLLFFGGSGALRDELNSQIASAGLAKRVRLLGFIPDENLATAYQAADLSIMPSQSLEGFGLSTLESLACGTPVVVAPVGGLPESVEALDTKLILRDKGSESIAEWLDSFLSGKLTLPVAEECRRYVELNFSWLSIAQRIKKVYSQVANE